MPKKILISKHRGTGAPKAFTMLNGSTSQIGTDLPEVMEANNTRSLGRNRILEFEGELYCAQTYNIFKYSASSGSWGLERGGSGLANSEPHLDYGLYVALVDDKPFLYHIFQSSTGADDIAIQKKESKFKGSGQWTEVASIDGPTTNFNGDTDAFFSGVIDVIQVGNTIYFTCSFEDAVGSADGVATTITFNMETENIGFISYPALESDSDIYAGPVCYCVHNGRLFIMVYEGFASGVNTIFQRISLIEIVGATGVKRDTIAFNASDLVHPFGTSALFEGRQVLFSDETNLYMMWHRYDSASDYGFHLQVYDAPVDSQLVTPIDDVETTVLPTSFTQDGGSLPNARARWTTYTQVDGSGNSEIYLTHAPFGTAGNIQTIYKFNGSGTPLTTEGVGGDAAMSLPNNRQGGGQYEWSQFKPFDSQIEDIRPSDLLGNILIDFRIIGGSGQDVTAKFLYDVEGEHLTTFANIQTPTPSGSISDGQTITGLVADSGILYTVNWQAQSDGVEIGDEFAISPLITLVV